MSDSLSKASYSSAVGAYPYCIITHAPYIFFQAVITNLKTARTIPAKRQFSATDMATIVLRPAPVGTFGADSGFFFSFGIRH
jgi:hypothetical protein